MTRKGVSRSTDVVLPMPAGPKGLKSRPQGEMDGPMIKIKHILKIRVVCRNIGSVGEDMASPLLVGLGSRADNAGGRLVCTYPVWNLSPIDGCHIQISKTTVTGLHSALPREW